MKLYFKSAVILKLFYRCTILIIFLTSPLSQLNWLFSNSKVLFSKTLIVLQQLTYPLMAEFLNKFN